MKTVRLGRTGVPVSKLCFGTMTMGGAADEAESKKLYAACRDAGVTFFDCADTYNGGRTEEILGKLIAHERDEIVLTSKCVMTVGDDPNPANAGANRRHIMRAVDNSLRRLGTDRLDILFLHKWDDATPMEQSLRALDDVVKSGKAVYVGVSNWSAWQMAKALRIQERNGWQPLDVMQPMYNLVKRQAEVEILPFAQDEDMAVICYGPGGGGLLSGKFKPGVKPDNTRLVDNAEYVKRYDRDWYYETAERFTQLAQDWGRHPMSLAVAWAAHHPAITCPIIGARSVDQLQAGLAAADIDLSDDEWDQIAALSQTPPPATDRLEEQG
jgi:aryl-alcohol dehydrogenase-like predicted oxidoreductase